MKSSERFSAGFSSRDRPVHRPRTATHIPIIVKERLERKPGTLRFSIPGRENIGCSKTPTVDRLRDERAKKELVFRYTAPDGETVAIPRIAEPYKFLHVNQNASRAEIKAAFLRDVNHSRRQDRALASLSYSILMSKVPRYRKISDDRFDCSQSLVPQPAWLPRYPNIRLWLQPPMNTNIHFYMSLLALDSMTRPRRFSRWGFL